MYDPAQRPDHPFLAAMRRCHCYDEGFTPEMVPKAIAAYFGLVSFLDHHIGKLVSTLDTTGLTKTTRFIYGTDHGDNLGKRGMWGKSTMYEESAGIPLIMAGPDIPAGVVSHAPVSLIDMFPTLVEGVGLKPDPKDKDLPGKSLLHEKAIDAHRVVLSEYHAACSATAAFMVRWDDWKYVHYVGMPPMLFNLANDPDERNDLGRDPAFAAAWAEGESRLRAILDPDAVDKRARADQREKIAEYGGEQAIRARGAPLYSPPPGSKVELVESTDSVASGTPS
jgi:choline-sulfatase